MERAEGGVYRATQYDQEDADEAFLLKALGGARSLYAASHGRSGMMSNSTLQRQTNIPAFRVFECEILPSTIKYNMDAFWFSVSPPETEVLIHLQCDDVKGLPNVRYDEDRKCVVGLCYHAHLNGVSTSIKTVDDIKAIREAVASDEVTRAP